MPDVIATQTGGTGGDRQPDGQVAGGAFVDADVQPEPAGPVGVLQRERQRGVARARAQHHIADAAADQFVDDDAGLCRRGIHQTSLVGGAHVSPTVQLLV